ncbi:MAG: hypothetical protein IAE93_05715 [Ignavibacteria bacterium]|nr:hypothetical protein [Ignavibacteria bacterium]
MSLESQLYDNDGKINNLVTKFSPHSSRIDKPGIINWLKQFQPKDIPLAIKLLENILFCDVRYSYLGFKNIYQKFKTVKQKYHAEYFSGAGSAGGSGSGLIRDFRVANLMRKKSHNSKFKYMSELSNLPNKNCSLLLLDDFVGTGNQALTYYSDLKDELNIPDEIDLYLGVLLASNKAITKIEDETDFTVINHHTLTDRDNVFASQNTVFNEKEKEILKHYCKISKVNEYLGYEDCGYIIAFSDSTPNNSIAVVKSNSHHFRGIFPRDGYEV